MEANAPSFSSWPILSEDERWIDCIKDHHHEYSIDTSGVVSSYVNGSQKILKTIIKNQYCCVQIFRKSMQHEFKIAELVTKAFLGTWEFIFIDGNKSNHALDNLCAKNDALSPGEVWIDGYEMEYSINADGECFSYYGNVKKRRKWYNYNGRLRVQFSAGREKKIMYQCNLLKIYFEGLTLAY